MTGKIGNGGISDIELAGVLAALGVIDDNVDDIKLVTENLPDGGLLTSIAQAVAVAAVKSVVDSIKAVTDNLPDSGALNDLSIVTANVGDPVDYVNVPFVEGSETALAYLATGYYHVHGASFVYPDKANPVQLTSSAASWSETGTITEVIPANAITKAFDIHWCKLSAISADLFGVVDIFAGAPGAEVKIGSVPLSRTSTFSSETFAPVQIPQQPANTRISCRFSDSTTSARTVSVKFVGHVYGTSL